MIRLQDRDVNLMNDIGTCEIMTYSQIQKLYFPTYEACKTRIAKLQKDDFIKGTFYNTPEKVFILSKDGVKIIANISNKVFEIGNYSNIQHKIMRSEFYSCLKQKKYQIDTWINEAHIEEINRYFDVSFSYNGKLYLVEIHNEQKNKILRQKLNECLKLNAKFTFIVYCKNKYPVLRMLKEMDSKGFSEKRNYSIKVIGYKEDFEL